MKKFLLLILFFLPLVSSCQTAEPGGTVIYLNGPSSSGKSTLSKALQEHFDEPYLHIGIDSMIAMMPEKLNDWTGQPAPEGFSWKKISLDDGSQSYEIKMGPYAQKMQETFVEVIRVLAQQGHNVIIDDVLYPGELMKERQAALKDLTVLYVGVIAPIEELERREIARGDRLVGTARLQHEQIHRGVDYDLMIDTFALSTEEAVRQIEDVLDRVTSKR